MDEAEKLCDRVAIVDHGKVISVGSPRELIAQLGGEHVLEFSLEDGASGPVAASTFDRVDGVTQAAEERGTYMLTVSEPHVSIPSCLQVLKEEQLRLKSLTTRHVNLEDVFVSLTGRHLRDE
jgi:ABC-2 type transport system ATP-binding protein